MQVGLRMIQIVLSLVFFCVLPGRLAAEVQLFRGDGLAKESLSVVLGELPKGTVLIIGEEHDKPDFARMQNLILQELYRLRPDDSLIVGMEFVDWTQQKELDAYQNKSLPEAEFLAAIGWSPFMNFGNYREQILYPETINRGRTYGINAPRALARRIRLNGPDGLSEDERALMPPNFARGREPYFARFKEAMKYHASPQEIASYFWAQSLWDSTMAFQIMRRQLEHQLQPGIFVVIVGRFHVEYGGGLPFELAPLLAPNQKMVTLVLRSKSVIEENGQNVDEVIKPHPEYGELADWILLL